MPVDSSTVEMTTSPYSSVRTIMMHYDTFWSILKIS